MTPQAPQSEIKMRRRKSPSRFFSEVLEQRTLLSASPVRLNNIGYFASESEPKIERFDINAGTWMTPIVLQGATTGTSVLHVDADGIYTATGNSVYRPIRRHICRPVL